MSTLIHFLQQQKEASKPELQVQRRKEWLNVLNVFFESIQLWLAEAEQKKLIKVNQGQIKLTEETLGTYIAPILTLTVGSKTVKLKPVGSVIIGANGRIDMESPNGTYMFLYLGDKGKWVHGSGKRPSNFTELTKELFENLLQRALV